MKKVNLTNGGVTLVDDADFASVSQYKWRRQVNGYAVWNTREKGVQRAILLHRSLLNPPAGMQVDHINGDKLDNRRSNIRICTKSQNAINTHHHKSKSGYRGVYWSPSSKKWFAAIRIDGIQDKKEAALAFNNAAIMRDKNFVVTNQI